MSGLNSDQQAQLQQQARTYLQEQLGPRAPQWLRLAGMFDERPLDGEGVVGVFAFDLAPTPGAAEHAGDYDPRHYVVAGETELNYYPQAGLAADEIYSVHLGTRFMLTLGAAGMPPAEEPPGAREALKAVLRGMAPDAELADVTLAALFRCGEQVFAVYRLRVNDEEVFAFGADCPPGFYRHTDLSPPVVLRLHLGQVIRQEKPERDDAQPA